LELNQQVNSRFFTELQLLLEYLLKLQSFLQQRQERQPQPEAPQQEILQMVYILLQEAQLVQEAANHQQLSSRRLSERHQLLEPELRIIQSSMQILEQLKVRARRQLATKH